MGQLLNRSKRPAGALLVIAAATGLGYLMLTRPVAHNPVAGISSPGTAGDSLNMDPDTARPLSTYRPAQPQSAAAAYIQAERAIARAEQLLQRSALSGDETDDTPAVAAPIPIGWSFDVALEDEPTLPLNNQIHDFASVSVPATTGSRPASGDQLVIPLLNGEEVTVEVTSSRTIDNGDYTWSGHLQGYGTDYPVVMTYGKHSSFAMITTPQGAYSMETVNGSGWLYKNPSEAELTTPGQDDFLEPPLPDETGTGSNG